MKTNYSLEKEKRKICMHFKIKDYLEFIPAKEMLHGQINMKFYLLLIVENIPTQNYT